MVYVFICLYANIQFNQKKKNPKTFVSTHLQLVVITPHPVVHRALSWPGIKLPCVSSLVRVGRLLRPLVHSSPVSCAESEEIIRILINLFKYLMENRHT